MHDGSMRTTIELDDDVRAELIRRSAERGDRGYSDLVNEMLKRSLGIDERLDREARARRIEALAGSITDDEAERMVQRIREVRERWRTDL
jgi:Arc/MetJ family transcription regulator